MEAEREGGVGAGCRGRRRRRGGGGGGGGEGEEAEGGGGEGVKGRKRVEMLSVRIDRRTNICSPTVFLCLKRSLFLPHHK